MRRLLAILVLSMVLVQAFLLPAAVRADTCIPGVTMTWAFNTLPVTDIKDTTAVFHGSVCMIVKEKIVANKPTDGFAPFVFEYGTTPGVYPNRVDAEYVSYTENLVENGDGITYTLCETYKASVRGLNPCDTYYMRINFSYPVYYVGVEPCFTVRLGDAVHFMTTGCRIGPLGQGGAGTASGISTVPSWPKPVQMSNIVVQSAAVATPKVSPGQDVDVSASVTNKGTVNDAAKLTLYVNGEAVESKGVTVSSGQTSPVHFYVSRNEPGIYSVYVNGVSAGSFEVDPFANNDALIYSIIALFVLGIAGMLYFIMRRRTE